jgi:hypothetical protein
MGDLLSIRNTKKIIDIGIAIKEAFETTRRNEKESRSIERVVGRACGLVCTLSVSQAPMLQHPMKISRVQKLYVVRWRGKGGSRPPYRR